MFQSIKCDDTDFTTNLVDENTKIYGDDKGLRERVYTGMNDMYQKIADRVSIQNGDTSVCK